MHLLQPCKALKEQKPHTFLDAGMSQKTPVNASLNLITWENPPEKELVHLHKNVSVPILKELGMN